MQSAVPVPATDFSECLDGISRELDATAIDTLEHLVKDAYHGLMIAVPLAFAAYQKKAMNSVFPDQSTIYSGLLFIGTRVASFFLSQQGLSNLVSKVPEYHSYATTALGCLKAGISVFHDLYS